MNEDSINLNSEKLKNIPLSNLRAKNLLTLRKEKINNSHLMKRLHSTIENESIQNYSIDINSLNVSSNDLVKQFYSSNDVILKLNLSLKMLENSNKDILKFSLCQIRNFTFIQDEKSAKNQNLINIINKKVINLLYDLITFPNQENQIIYTILEIFIYLTYCLNDYIEILIDKSEEIFKLGKETNVLILKKKYFWCILHLLSGTSEQAQKLISKCPELPNYIMNELEIARNNLKKNYDILSIYICLFGCLFFFEIETDKIFLNETKFFDLFHFIIKCTTVTYQIFVFKESINTLNLILESYNFNPNLSKNKEYNKKFKSIIKKTNVSKSLSIHLCYLTENYKLNKDNNIDFSIFVDIFSILSNISELSNSECEKMVSNEILEPIKFIFDIYQQNQKMIKKEKLFSSILILLYNFSCSGNSYIIDEMTRKVYIVRPLMELYKKPESKKYKSDILSILENILEYSNTKVKTELTVDHIEEFYSYCLDESENNKYDEIINYSLKGIKILLEYGKLFGKYNAIKIQFENKGIKTKLEKISLNYKYKENSIFASKILNDFFK